MGRGLIIGAAVCLTGVAAYFAMTVWLASGMIAGAPPGPAHVSPRQAYVPSVARALADALGAGQDVEIRRGLDDPGDHVFWGNVTTEDGACLVNLRRAHWVTAYALDSRSGVQFPAPEKFLDCGAFVRVTPPDIPPEFAAFGSVTRPVRHICQTTLEAGADQIWERGDRPSGHVSFATLKTGAEMGDVLARAIAADGQVVQVGGNDASPVHLTRRGLLQSADITPVATLRCAGFDVHHVTIRAKRWPLP